MILNVNTAQSGSVRDAALKVMREACVVASRYGREVVASNVDGVGVSVVLDSRDDAANFFRELTGLDSANDSLARNKAVRGAA